MATDPTLIRIRERSFADLLDLGLVVLRSRPVPLGLAAVAGVAPFLALNAWLAADPETFVLPVYLALLALEAPWATAPLTVVLGGLMFGERVTAGRVARAVFKGLPSLLFYHVLIRGFLIGTVVFSPVVPAKLAFVDEVVLLERASLFRTAKRSSTLCGLRGTDLFGQWVAQVFIGGLFAACFWGGTGAVVNALTTSELTWDEPGWSDLYSVRFQVAVWLAIVYFGVVRFLSYIDQRIRLEGWEVKQRLVAVGQSMREAGPW